LLVRMFRSSPSASRHVSIVGFPVHQTAEQRRDESGSRNPSLVQVPASLSHGRAFG
jgi:hypothetical protein